MYNKTEEEFVEYFKPFINNMSNKLFLKYLHYSAYLTKEDLQQNGYVGLLDGISKCDFSRKDYQIDTYLKKRIMGEMVDRVRESLPAKRSKYGNIDKVSVSYMGKSIPQGLSEPTTVLGDLFVLEAINSISNIQHREILFRHVILEEKFSEIPYRKENGSSCCNSAKSLVNTACLNRISSLLN